MYKAFFHLKRNPFDVHPDTYFMYATPCHHEAFASLYYGIRSHKGFMVLTGEVGTGKTLVLRCLTEQLDKLRVQFAYVFNPVLSPEEFLKYVLADLGLRGQYTSKNELLFQFYGFLAQRQKLDQTTVLIVDEAHLLSPELLEEVRLLGNLENQHGKLLQVALVGQPELDTRLDSNELRQLKQRVALRCQLQPLNRRQTEEYVSWRLRRAGANGQAPIFCEEAIREVYEYSGGYPRLINTICENSLIFACGTATRTISTELVAAACKDLRIERRLEAEEEVVADSATNKPQCASQVDLNESVMEVLQEVSVSVSNTPDPKTLPEVNS
jgi:general secretion pathway protein A